MRTNYDSNIGNQYAVKLKDLETKLKVYDHYCKHLEKGKDKRKWYYDDGDTSLIYESLTHYFEREPDVFDPIKRQIAERKGFQKWEEVCEQTASGDDKKASVPALNMIMRNKYGWDKEAKEDLQEKRNPITITVTDGRNTVQPETS